MRILIVDDEELAQKRLVRLLKELGVSDVRVCDSAKEALAACEDEQFDLALLDIHMPNMSGIELGYQLRYMNQEMSIIFQSAHSEHALTAFDIGAVGYLVKPYSKEDLERSMSRVRLRDPEEPLRLLSKAGSNYLLLRADEIFYVKADLSEVILRSAQGFSYLAKKISDVERLLEPYNFAKIHRSYLINLDKIEEIETIEQSKLQFSFKGINDKIDSSKEGAKLFRERYKI